MITSYGECINVADVLDCNSFWQKKNLVRIYYSLDLASSDWGWGCLEGFEDGKSVHWEDGLGDRFGCLGDFCFGVFVFLSFIMGVCFCRGTGWASTFFSYFLPPLPRIIFWWLRGALLQQLWQFVGLWVLFHSLESFLGIIWPSDPASRKPSSEVVSSL